MKIRKAKLNDAKRASLMVGKTLEEINSKDYNTSQIEVFKEKNTVEEIRKRIKESDMYLAFAGDKLVGSVAFHNKRFWQLYVRPSFVGKGVGSALMDYIEIFARKKGLKKVKLYSTITAKDFYLERGYKILEKFKARMGNVGIVMFDMEKRLK